MTRWLVFIAASLVSIPSYSQVSVGHLHLHADDSSLTPFQRAAQSFSGESIAKEICYSISADNRREFENILNRNSLRIRGIFSAVKCNSYSLLQFAVIAEATDTGMLLTRSLPARVILAEDENGDSIIEWAETTGYHNSPIILAIRERQL